MVDIRRGSMHSFAVKSVAIENSNRSSLRGSIVNGNSSVGGSGTKRKPDKLHLDSSQIKRDVDMFSKQAGPVGVSEDYQDSPSKTRSRQGSTGAVELSFGEEATKSPQKPKKRASRIVLGGRDWAGRGARGSKKRLNLDLEEHGDATRVDGKALVQQANFELGSDQFDFPGIKYTPRQSDVVNSYISPIRSREGRKVPLAQVLREAQE